MVDVSIWPQNSGRDNAVFFNVLVKMMAVPINDSNVLYMVAYRCLIHGSI